MKDLSSQELTTATASSLDTQIASQLHSVCLERNGVNHIICIHVLTTLHPSYETDYHCYGYHNGLSVTLWQLSFFLQPFTGHGLNFLQTFTWHGLSFSILYCLAGTFFVGTHVFRSGLRIEAVLSPSPQSTVQGKTMCNLISALMY